MPFIVLARPDMEHTAGKALAGLGRNIAEIGTRLADRRAREKAMEAELTRAQAQLAREQRVTGERDADREGSLRGLEEIGQRDQEGSVNSALEQHKGQILGPFGILNPRMIGAAALAGQAAQRRGLERMELAKRMSPEGARMFLARETENEKKAARETALKAELEALQGAVADGVLDEVKAQRYSKALQTATREGRDPGAIHERLAKEYDMHAKVKQRLRAWEQADKDAAALIQSIEQAGAVIQDPEAKQVIQEKVAKARGEWGNTEYQDFRSKSDPGQTLGALQAILFSAQAGAMPSGGGPMGITRAEKGVQDDAVRNDAFTPERGAANSDWSRQMGQGVGMPARGAQPQPITAAPPQTAGPKLTPMHDKVLLAGAVRQGAQKALAAGTREERAARIGDLRKAIADDLGLDVEDPTVIALVREALSRNYERGK